jgi:hypothetical protein
MTSPVERLNDLLGRVQRNRRASGPPVAASPATGLVAAAPSRARVAPRDSLPAALDPEILSGEEFPVEPERGSVPISLDASNEPPPAVEVPRAAAVPYEARAPRDLRPPSYAPVQVKESPFAAASEDAPAIDAESAFGERASFEEPFEESLSQPPRGEVEGSVVTAPPAPQPSRPIAQVVSRHPPIERPTFGKLLARSLSLRAR